MYDAGAGPSSSHKSTGETATGLLLPPPLPRLRLLSPLPALLLTLPSPSWRVTLLAHQTRGTRSVQ